jgi:hypothetical protein
MGHEQKKSLTTIMHKRKDGPKTRRHAADVKRTKLILRVCVFI